MSGNFYVQLDSGHESILGVWLDEAEAEKVRAFVVALVTEGRMP